MRYTSQPVVKFAVVSSPLCSLRLPAAMHSSFKQRFIHRLQRDWATMLLKEKRDSDNDTRSSCAYLVPSPERIRVRNHCLLMQVAITKKQTFQT